jgi:two-component system osmolarity sensor histidine kinase EnvZ
MTQAEVVAEMAGGVEGLEPPFFALEHRAIGQKDIGGEIGIDTLAAARKPLICKTIHRRGAAGAAVAEGEDRRAGGFRQRAGEGGVIDMAVGDEDMGDGPAANRRKKRLKMCGACGAGVDHRNGPVAQEIAVGAPEGHGRGVRGQNPGNTVAKVLQNSGFRAFAVSHGAFFRSVPRLALGMFFVWLKQYMPRSLYGRATLILLMPVVAVQIIVSVVFIQRHYDWVTRQMTQTVAEELAYLAEGIAEAVDTEAAVAFAEGFGRAMNMTVDFGADAASVRPVVQWYDLSGHAMRRLLEAVPEVTVVDLEVGWRVKVWLETARGGVAVNFARTRVAASNPHQLIVIMLVLGAFLTLISFFFLRNQLRPIKRMAEAATEFGKGRVVPFNPTGATEVRAAGTAFLEMRARIDRQVQTRSLMLSGVGHDLRTPLTRLRLALSMMDEKEAAPLISDVEDMHHLVEAFLEFGRQDASDKPEETDPAALLTQVIKDAERAGQAVALAEGSLAEGAISLPLRPMALRRALDNLIGNGLRYGSAVRVGVRVTERTVVFSVEDDGPGIPEARQDEAMRPFTRLDPARNQNRGSGVGLGLAIVADVARLHGGSLRLGQSEALGGLLAEIVIPR